MVMVLAPWRMPPAFALATRSPQNTLPIDTVMTKETVVLGGEKRLNELGRQLVVAHRYAPLLADGCDQPPVARIDAKRNLQLHFAQAFDIRQRGLQIDISADIGESNECDRSRQDYANAGYEN